jgi:hypothetical protein
MRCEIIRCDTCNKEHNAQDILPREWVATKQREGYCDEEEHHFCSKTCLIKWSGRDECLYILSTSISFLMPQEALTGAAGIMSQMQTVENVKEDFKKLKGAIAVLRKDNDAKEASDTRESK